RPGCSYPAPRDASAPAVLLPGRTRARALRLAARTARAGRVPAPLHGGPVPIQPRPADGERALVRVPLSARVLHLVLAPGDVRAHAPGGRGLGAGGVGEQPRGLPRLRHRAALARTGVDRRGGRGRSGPAAPVPGPTQPG